jgi:hypothetical protein
MVVLVVTFHMPASLVCSVSYDGSVKCWNPETLDLIVAARHAHNDERVQCMAVGPDGWLYTGAVKLVTVQG